MADKFSGYADSVASPSRAPVAIVPSDTADLANVPKAIFVGTGGDIALIGIDGAPETPVLFRNVPTGTTLDVCARRIIATGTTAQDLVALV
jgi:hypothetical protein